jgi:hypothetical protein
MGNKIARADIGIAISKTLQSTFSQDVQTQFCHSDEVINHDTGHLFIFWSIEPKTLEELFQHLKESDRSEFLVICAFTDFPKDDSYDMGTWTNNPFGLRKYFSASITYDDIEP